MLAYFALFVREAIADPGKIHFRRLRTFKATSRWEDIVVCSINDAHAALSDFGDDAVVAERLADHV